MNINAMRSISRILGILHNGQRRLLSSALQVMPSQEDHLLQLPARAKGLQLTTCHISTSNALHKYPSEQNLHVEQIAAQQARNEEIKEMTELMRDFLDPAEFFTAVKAIGIEFFCGVPDSLLKDFCAYVTSHTSPEHHIITPNEGTAVALASGYHLATNKPAMVYLQNSGLGNIINPVLSLASPSVYRIPMLLLVGWRGEPGKRDEPQHKAQGEVTPALLASVNIPFQTLPDYKEGAQEVLLSAKEYMNRSGGPYCLLVKRQTFLPFDLEDTSNDSFPLTREAVLQVIVDNLKDNDVVVGTTGMLSRELFEHRVRKGQSHDKDFLTVGSMGHASAIAMGIAMYKTKRQVFCLDGDGAVLMHMGTLASIGQNGPSNLKHIIINNGAHDSVGGQPTIASNHAGFSFTAIAKACGYKEAWCAVTPSEIATSIQILHSIEGPALVEIKTKQGYRKDLGRPTRRPVENKLDFMQFLQVD